jgi:integrase
MARRPTGAVVEHAGNDGRTYRALRFTAYGKRRYVSLGPVSQGEAQRELRHVLADVERGTWQTQPAVETPPELEPVPTFHEFAEQWWILTERQLAPKTKVDYRWRLERHLLPYFAERPLDKIDVDFVERYMAAKLAEDQPLSPRSINMTLILLGAILESAIERELIVSNPAKGKRRRIRTHAPRRTYLDTAERIAALLQAAGELDALAAPHHRHVRRRAMLATLVFAGLRIGELCALRWRDVDLAAGRLTVGEAKTDAGRRRVKLRGALRDELVSIKPSDADLDGYVFPTSKGKRFGADNLRNRVLTPAAERACAELLQRGLTPLPHLTPHSLRRTFASVLYAIGEPPPVAMAELGHTHPGLALAVYAQVMRQDDGQRACLRALVEGGQLADKGIPGNEVADLSSDHKAA